jgi:DDE superfamily endonuclease
MVRSSMRQKVLNRVDDIILAAVKQLFQRQLLGLPTANVEELIYRCRKAKIAISNRRYLLQRGSYRKRTSKFQLYLDADHVDGLNDREFLFHFRMSRECFWELVSLLKNHPNFNRVDGDSRGSCPRPAEQQLLVLLKYFGSDGNSASSFNIGAFFGISYGNVKSCRLSALQALLTLEDRTYFWPDSEERKQIANRIREAYLFPNCVGLIDGTLLPLATRPLLHGENYLSRKRFYAIVMLVVCDDQSRILYYHVGWPGSVHDNRVWRTCKLFKNCAVMFSPREYLLGDSAFTASDILIPPFKSAAGSELSANYTAFNTLLAKPRVKSEHCIGLLKGRFPFLRGIRMLIGNKLHMSRIIDHVRAAVVLHNFMISQPYEDDWIDSDEGVDDLEPEGTLLMSNDPDSRRRSELMFYLSELEETTIN